MSRLHPFSRRYGILWMAAFSFALLILPHQTFSQDGARPNGAAAARAIALADIEGWWSIHGSALSPDGQWFAHRAGPANGNDELVVRQTKGDKEYRFSTGASGAGTLLFSPDSKWMVFTANAPRSGKGQTGEGDAGGDGDSKKTVLLNLTAGTKVSFDN